MVPDRANVVGALDDAPDDQVAEVAVHDEAGGVASAAVAVADRAVVGLDTDDDLPEVGLPGVGRRRFHFG